MEIYSLIKNCGYDGKEIEGSSFTSLDTLVEYVRKEYPNYIIPENIWKESEFYPNEKEKPSPIVSLDIETTILIK